jgi:hypothetical protein
LSGMMVLGFPAITSPAGWWIHSLGRGLITVHAAS